MPHRENRDSDRERTTSYVLLPNRSQYAAPHNFLPETLHRHMFYRETSKLSPPPLQDNHSFLRQHTGGSHPRSHRYAPVSTSRFHPLSYAVHPPCLPPETPALYHALLISAPDLPCCRCLPEHESEALLLIIVAEDHSALSHPSCKLPLSEQTPQRMQIVPQLRRTSALIFSSAG